MNSEGTTVSHESVIFLYKALLEKRANISGLGSEAYNTEVESLNKSTVFHVGQLPHTDKLQTH